MSDTPETDAAWVAWTYAGPGVHANFARKLERERDEARKKEECYIEEIKTLRADVERLETLYEAMKREKNDYQSQRDNIRLEADQLSTELHLERFSLKEMDAEVERLKADKARMDWLASLDCDSPLWDALSDTTKLRSIIDAAMKGAE